MKRKALIISIPITAVWIGSAFFFAKWTIYWHKGNLIQGNNTSGTVLFVFFLACLIALVFGFYTTSKAWFGKSNTKWQVISLICAILVLLAVAGD